MNYKSTGLRQFISLIYPLDLEGELINLKMLPLVLAGLEGSSWRMEVPGASDSHLQFLCIVPRFSNRLSPSQKLKRLTPPAPLRRLITCIEVLKAHFSQGRILQADRRGSQNTYPITKDCLRLKEFPEPLLRTPSLASWELKLTRE